MYSRESIIQKAFDALDDLESLERSVRPRRDNDPAQALAVEEAIESLRGFLETVVGYRAS